MTLKKRELNKIRHRLNSTEIISFRDTGDMPHFLTSYPANTHQPMHYKWGIAMFWRCFSNRHLWACLEKFGAVPPAEEPRWDIANKVFTECVRKSAASHGGVFRTPIMKSYRNSASEKLTSIEHLPTPERETLAYKTMWKALPRTELAAFSKHATRDTFKNALEKFTKNLYGKEGLTKGKFNDYSVKCMIDALLVNDTVNRNIISPSPRQCPAYKAQLPNLFPGIKPARQLVLCTG